MPRGEQDVVVRVVGREVHGAARRPLEAERHELRVVVTADRVNRCSRVRAAGVGLNQLDRRVVVQKSSGSPRPAPAAVMSAKDGSHEAVQRQVDDQVDEPELVREVLDSRPAQVLWPRRVEVAITSARGLRIPPIRWR